MKALTTGHLTIEVTHLRALHPALPLPAEVETFDLSDSAADCEALLPTLKDFLHLRPVRRVNWPQTFARHGLEFQHYSQFDTREARTRYPFWRAPGAPSSAPQTLEFKRDLNAPGLLQGDVLTAYRSSLTLHALIQDSFWWKKIKLESLTDFHKLTAPAPGERRFCLLPQFQALQASLKAEPAQFSGWEPATDLLRLYAWIDTPAAPSFSGSMEIM